MENYHVLEPIGEGSFAKVFKARRKFTGQYVALKFVPKGKVGKAQLQTLRQEIHILKAIKHDNIVALLDFFETDSDIIVVTEYAHCELFSILNDDKRLKPETVQLIALQLCRALAYLHANRIIHRDLKPQNVLVASPSPSTVPRADGSTASIVTPRVVLGDLGLARVLPGAVHAHGQGQGHGASPPASPRPSSSSSSSSSSNGSPRSVKRPWALGADHTEGKGPGTPSGSAGAALAGRLQAAGRDSGPWSSMASRAGSAAVNTSATSHHSEPAWSQAQANGPQLQTTSQAPISSPPHHVEPHWSVLLTSFKGTPLYMSPEQLRHGQYGTPADVWALGTLLFELLAGYPPFYADSLAELVRVIGAHATGGPGGGQQSGDGQPPSVQTPVPVPAGIAWPEGLPQDCRSFLEACLCPDPAARPTAEKLLGHPWMLSAGL